MTVTQRLYEAARPIWEACHAHPFVTGIGDGTLEVEKFRYFLLQDYLYLFDYARVFAWGVVKARSPELMRFFSANVDAILGGEMKIHRAYMARLGITEEQVFAVRPALPNLSYTNYMLSAAAAGGPAEIVAAILACSWSYAEIGTRLAARPGALEHPFYGEWVQGYSSEEYQETNRALVERMDALAAGCSEEEYRRLEEIFVACSRYELGFWEMAWKLEA
ncbi:thiaminase II [Pseudoflavonifractor sp. DSM 107456]|uniref:Aminopyrimidine aminohydrolase n=2 Tax=Pseudoflavonifractor TaxID=1017280 RepID=A0ABR9R7F1_9FIRM|nr:MULTISPECIES: thiaminase II [Eubacteriales]MBS5135067.1 thiaminase II [Oscillospiraceae bacterium]MBS6216039.1 thiaminase II [Clostridiales bacterium]MBC5730015.1 thiaminase II [Pseudoflavonifractor hominis]MBE5054618.1 thiaminase II [Pseudoflavonifractor gallinarum]MBT9685797.1 thiaminase II [Pseudoflavonifractor sp. MCC625]